MTGIIAATLLNGIFLFLLAAYFFAIHRKAGSTMTLRALGALCGIVAIGKFALVIELVYAPREISLWIFYVRIVTELGLEIAVVFVGLSAWRIKEKIESDEQKK